MGTTDSSVTYSGWNIDDIQILGEVPVVVTCPTDLDGNDVTNINDLVICLGAFGQNADGDVDGDDDTDINDLVEVLAQFGNACP